MKRNELLFRCCIAISSLWGGHLLFLDKTEPSTELYDMPYITYGPFQPVMWGQRMLCVYEMYSISEKNSAVALLINTTPSVKQEVSLHSNKNPCH